MDSPTGARSSRSCASSCGLLCRHWRMTLARRARYSETICIMSNPASTRPMACRSDAPSSPAAVPSAPPCPRDFTDRSSASGGGHVACGGTQDVLRVVAEAPRGAITRPGAMPRANCSHSATMGSALARMKSASRMKGSGRLADVDRSGSRHRTGCAARRGASEASAALTAAAVRRSHAEGDGAGVCAGLPSSPARSNDINHRDGLPHPTAGRRSGDDTDGLNGGMQNGSGRMPPVGPSVAAFVWQWGKSVKPNAKSLRPNRMRDLVDVPAGKGDQTRPPRGF